MRKMNIPAEKALHKLGRDLRDARKRRRVKMQLQSDRAGISRITLSRIEKGDPSVCMGAYMQVLFVLGMENRIGDLVDATTDKIGRFMEEENLPKRVR